MPAAAGSTAVIAGGGIAGLTAAVTLQQRGWRVEILERAHEPTTAGAGLSLWPNGLRALDAVGVGTAVRQEALSATTGGLRDTAGRWLASTDIAELRRRHGHLVMIHRTRLAELLRDALGTATLRSGAGVQSVETTAHGVRVRYTGGCTEAALLIGADGINSNIRAIGWPQAAVPRYAGYTAWRTIVTPPTPVHTGGETLGRGERFGIAPMRDGRVYFFAAAGVPGGAHSPDGELAELHRRFATWHDPIPGLLTAATEEQILRHDIYQLPPVKSYVRQRTALIGDAAHAMTPDLGQGANLAIEDAVTLAVFLDQAPDLPTALTHYDRIRRKRVEPLTQISRWMGAAAQLSAPPVAALRNTVLRLTPTRAALRALDPVLSWDPPT